MKSANSDCDLVQKAPEVKVKYHQCISVGITSNVNARKWIKRDFIWHQCVIIFGKGNDLSILIGH